MFPIAGPRGWGTVYLEATKAGGVWDFDRLEVEIEESGARIDLLRRCEENGIRDVLLFSTRGTPEFDRKFGFVERSGEAPGMILRRVREPRRREDPHAR